MDGWIKRMDDVFKYILRICRILEERATGNVEPNVLALAQQAYTLWLVDLPLELWDLQVPFYGVTLNAENSLQASATVQSTGKKMLNQFVDLILRPSADLAGIPPSYVLTIQKEFFSSENYQSFANFLAFPNTVGLMGMSMSIPNNGGYMNFIFPHPLYFPQMREFRILFSNEGTAEPSFRSNDHFVPFIQMILHGTSRLEKLLFHRCQNNVIPAQLQNLTLPGSLTSLYLQCELTSDQLDRLTARRLPNLRNFGVLISRHTFENNLLFLVLDRFNATLQSLHFYGINFDENCYGRRRRAREASYFDFPLMQSLQLFSTFSIHGELIRGLPQGTLEEHLPQLNHVWLKHQTIGMFQKWTNTSHFPTVTILGVGLVDDSVPLENLCHDIGFSELHMENVHRAFPNVTVLNLNVTDNLSGLVCLFSGRLRHVELKLEVKKNELPSYFNIWDCLLIGISIHDMIQRQRLQANPRSVNNLNIDPNFPSIRKFTALRFLALSASFLPALENQDSLISDAAFRFAFLQMPTLNKLQFVGMFRATHEATEVWKSHQRSIDYFADD